MNGPETLMRRSSDLRVDAETGAHSLAAPSALRTGSGRAEPRPSPRPSPIFAAAALQPSDSFAALACRQARMAPRLRSTLAQCFSISLAQAARKLAARAPPLAAAVGVSPAGAAS